MLHYCTCISIYKSDNQHLTPVPNCTKRTLWQYCWPVTGVSNCETLIYILLWTLTKVSYYFVYLVVSGCKRAVNPHSDHQLLATNSQPRFVYYYFWYDCFVVVAASATVVAAAAVVVVVVVVTAAATNIAAANAHTAIVTSSETTSSTSSSRLQKTLNQH